MSIMMPTLTFEEQGLHYYGFMPLDAFMQRVRGPYPENNPPLMVDGLRLIIAYRRTGHGDIQSLVYVLTPNSFQAFQAYMKQSKDYEYVYAALQPVQLGS